MRVAMVTPEFPPRCGGIGYYVYYLARTLLEVGLDVQVLVRGGPGGREYRGVRAEGLAAPGVPPFSNRRFAREAHRALRAVRPDLVHVHAASLPVLETGLPLVVTSHSCIGAITPAFYRPIRDPESLYRNLLFGVYRRLERALVTACDRLTVVSRSMRDDYRELYGVEADVVYNGVDLEAFRPAPSAAAPQRPRILYVGALKRGKGLLCLLEAASLLNREFPGVEYALYGQGPLRGRLSAVMAAERLENVRLAGPIGHDDLPEVLRSATVAVLPSHYEGLPNAVLEAMACGLPVVASRVRGNVETVRHGSTGYLFEAGDAPELAARLGALLGDPASAREMGRRGRERVEQEFTWAQVKARFLAVFERARSARQERTGVLRVESAATSPGQPG